MKTQLGTCEDCGKDASADCMLLICEDSDGFVIICCIVYAINHNLTILQQFTNLGDTGT